MLAEVKQMAQRALNRLNNLLSRGILTGITPKKTPTAAVTLYDKEKYEGVEFAQEFGFISYPPADGTTEVVVAFFGGQRDHGTVLKSFNKTKALNLPLEEGESAVYNAVTGTYIHLKADGGILIRKGEEGNTSIELKADGTILIKTDADEGVTVDAPKVTMTGDLFVEGNVTVDGDVLDNDPSNDNTVKDMRDIFNEHVHSGVVAGGDNSLEPTSSM